MKNVTEHFFLILPDLQGRSGQTMVGSNNDREKEKQLDTQ